MNKSEILVLGTGLSLFVGAKKEIAERAKVSPTMVNRTLRGAAGETATTQKIVRIAKKLYEELCEKNDQYREHLTAQEQ